MKYVKINAKTYNEALIKLREEHGDEAIPISHKYVKDGGFFNSKFLAKNIVELTAAITERKTYGKKKEQKKKLDFTVGLDDELELPKKREYPINEKNLNKNIDINELMQNIDKAQKNLGNLDETYVDNTKENFLNNLKMDKDFSKSIPVTSKTIEVSPTLDSELPEPRRSFSSSLPSTTLEKEVRDLKDMVSKLLSQKNEVNQHADDLEMSPFYNILQKNDFGESYSNSIIEETKKNMSSEDLSDKYKIEKTMKELIKSKIVTTGPIGNGKQKKVIMFVGPTGVGKTTTMAKLGAVNSLRGGKSVAFITLDNYRIAATEQLKKYAEIMKIPIHAINEPNEFKRILDEEKADIIFVDTSGRSHKNDLKIAEIKSFADVVGYELETKLCVSATTKKNDLKDIFESFEVMEFDNIVITKVDETSFIGNIVEVADNYNKPISYFTNGQEVPNDIVVADQNNLVEMVIRDSNI